MKLAERLVAVESVKQMTVRTVDEETQSSQLLFMADVLQDNKADEDQEGEETECNEETEGPVFAKPKPKMKPEAKSKNAQKLPELNVATPPQVTSTQKVRLVREQEEELNSMLDEWESENQYMSYEALPDDATHPFLSKPKPSFGAKQSAIDLTPSPARGVDDTASIVSLSQFVDTRDAPPAISSKTTTQPAKPKALVMPDQSSPSEEDRLVADKVTEIVLEYQRLIQTKKRELAMRMKVLKDEYYKEVLFSISLSPIFTFDRLAALL